MKPSTIREILKGTSTQCIFLLGTHLGHIYVGTVHYTVDEPFSESILLGFVLKDESLRVFPSDAIKYIVPVEGLFESLKEMQNE